MNNNEVLNKMLEIIRDLKKQVQPILPVLQEFQNQIEPLRQQLKQTEEISENMSQMVHRSFIGLKGTLSPIQDSIDPLLRTIEQNNKFLSSIIHMPLYRDILKQINSESIEYIESSSYHYNITEGNTGELKVVRPYFLDTAMKINIYVTVTNDAIEQNSELSKDDKNLWSRISVILLFLVEIFMSWAMGDTPITDMQIVKQFEKIVEVVENYEYPIETTEIDTNDNK